MSPVSVTSDCEAVDVLFMFMELASVTRDICVLNSIYDVCKTKKEYSGNAEECQ